MTTLKVIYSHERPQSLNALLSTYVNFWDKKYSFNSLLILDSSTTSNLAVISDALQKIKNLKINFDYIHLPQYSFFEKEKYLMKYINCHFFSVLESLWISLCTDQDLFIEPIEDLKQLHSANPYIYPAPFVGWAPYQGKNKDLILLRPMSTISQAPSLQTISPNLQIVDLRCDYPNTNVFWSLQNFKSFKARIQLQAYFYQLANSNEYKFLEVLYLVLYSFFDSVSSSSAFALRAMDHSNTLRKKVDSEKNYSITSFSGIYKQIRRDEERYLQLLLCMKRVILASLGDIDQALREAIKVQYLDKKVLAATSAYYNFLFYDSFQESYVINRCCNESQLRLSRNPKGITNYNFLSAAPIFLGANYKLSEIQFLNPNSFLLNKTFANKFSLLSDKYWEFCN